MKKNFNLGRGNYSNHLLFFQTDEWKENEREREREREKRFDRQVVCYLLLSH